MSRRSAESETKVRNTYDGRVDEVEGEMEESR